MDWTPVLRIALAAVLAAPIGLNRELTGKPAGLRTHMVVALATATLGYLSVEAAEGDPSADPTRIAAQTVTGIGFIGAGLIIGVRGRVHGLTTAAAVFAAAALGLTIGMGQYTAGVVLAAAVLIGLGPLDWIRARTFASKIRAEHTLHMLVERPADALEVQHIAVRAGLELRRAELGEAGGMIHVLLTVRGRPPQIAEARGEIDALTPDGPPAVVDEGAAAG